MKLENAELGYSCVVPDRPTVRQQLTFFAIVGSSNTEKFALYWEGAKALVSEWQCPALPDITASLDEISNPTQTRIVIDLGLRVVQHMNSLEDIDPN